ncbi:MAG: substrate-binding domain-containing protein [Ruminococcus sp.]|nr:substrate-binding domain-containing protein [Ruminococcus sp.]
MSKRILIGVIITECQVDFQKEILRGIISQAFKSNCDIAVLTPLHNFFMDTPHKQIEKKIFDLILSDRFDGFLYGRNTFYGEEIKTYIDNLLVRSGKPVMLMDSADHRSFETTSIDDCAAFEQITDHLIEVHGFTKIYCLTGPKKSFVSEERLKGYKNSMKKHGLYYDRSCCYYGDFWREAAKDLAKRMIRGEIERPEAIVCGNDYMAISLAEEFLAAGIRVPEDIALTGYDSSEDGYNFSPSITSFSRPNFQMGAEALRRLYRILTGKICNRVHNENGELRTGQSCGCPEDMRVVQRLQRQNKINARFESNMLMSDMLFDITNVDNPADFADRLDNYTYFIYKLRNVSLCLTRKYIDSPSGGFTDKLTFSAGDDVRMVLSKSAVRREDVSDEYFSSYDLLPVFNKERAFPVAYYISPLHYNSNFFGYSAISFGKEPISFSTLYLQWINYVNVALEQLRIKAMMNRTISTANHALLYDEVTGLLNRNGMEKAMSDRKNAWAASSADVDFIRIQLTGLNKTYFQSGEDKCRRVFAAFAQKLRECAKPDEICGAWSSNILGIVTARPERAGELFRELSEKVKDSQFSDGENCNVDFSLGQYSQQMSADVSLGNAMHKAAINRLFNYNISENSANPQFEKLCMLRSRIMKNPENPWNISEIAESLYLSKSYLQKIYKSYFNKSIIEEMIQFRIEKAKELLTNTDMTVTEISKECGYSSYNYFVRQFKISEGISPSEYRTKNGK